ncbi:kazal-type serine protease inhibitor domain-containing protein 1-like [Bombina bombina]|uniref:kazal-type serine protease inhibitor domain-containing protein 1-like n=1 Tax=Bombina bombina TaxID=8345 RepID=UPI00235B0B13|nr:kazal-type serine protease inhibitor domain-containing protein 1-like [Bombina bombina]
MKVLIVLILYGVILKDTQGSPTFYHRGWLRLLRGDICGNCDIHGCSKSINCPAGTVLDDCGCCPECGNVEGQICDLDNKNHFYGKCGENLECRLDANDNKFGEIPEPQCVCKYKESICGSDGKTYDNICQFNEIYSRSQENITLQHRGPCAAAPFISIPPKDARNFTGNDIIFGCEVSAFPMPHLEWRKEGNNRYLPGDDAHISVQTRGGPQRYGVTGWLQIEGIKKSDEGVYICVTKNKYGTTIASAKLKVVDYGSQSTLKYITSSKFSRYNTDDKNYYPYKPEEEGEGEEFGSGDIEN